MREPITKWTIHSLIGLLDFAYRLGLEDMAQCEDENRPARFLAETERAGVFGFLNEDHTMDWQEWTLRLMSKSRSSYFGTSMSEYYHRAGKFGQNYLSVFINMTQCYYNMAVRDALECEVPLTPPRLPHDKRRVRLTAKGFYRKVKMRGYVDDMQAMAYRLQRRDEAVWADGGIPGAAKRRTALKATHYRFFMKAVGLAMVKEEGFFRKT